MRRYIYLPTQTHKEHLKLCEWYYHVTEEKAGESCTDPAGLWVMGPTLGRGWDGGSPGQTSFISPRTHVLTVVLGSGSEIAMYVGGS